MDKEDHTYLFIGGCHRSGTTVLAKLISEHPQFDGFSNTGVCADEGQFLQSVYPSLYGKVGRFAFMKETHLTESSELATEGAGKRLFDDWAKYWDSRKPFLVEKTPSNIVRSRFLQYCFSRSYFIFVLRHPVAVALATQKWSKTSLTSLIEHTLECYRIMQEDIRHLNHAMIIRYEDFVKSPKDAFHKISNFLEVENAFQSTHIHPFINNKYYRKWELLKKSGNPWNRRLFKVMNYLKKENFPLYVNYQKEIEVIQLRFERELNQYGYSFDLNKPLTY